MTEMMVTTETCWIWTEKAADWYGSVKAGHPVFRPWLVTAPKYWLDKGYIQEATAEQTKLEL